MGRIIINGGKQLAGRIKVTGAKNTILPILAAAIISGKKSVIHGCPHISDVDNTLEILNDIGCKTVFSGDTITVDSSGVSKYTIAEELMDKMRSSMVLNGAVIARMKRAEASYPGGCELGLRPIDLHIKAFREMGIEISEEHGFISFDGRNIKSADIHLSYPSVGATENIMLAACGAKGKTRIINAAKEPEISDLADFINAMGGKVRGAGSSIIEIEGAEEYKDCEHTIIPDRIVAATYIAAAVITKSIIEIENINSEHMNAIFAAFKEAGVVFENCWDNVIKVIPPEKLCAVRQIRTEPYPGFPTDAQSIISSVLTLSEGTSIITENIFDRRFRHLDELIKMGADITINGNCAVIKGTDKLSGAKVSATDLRSGAALVIAALGADGVSEVANTCYIDRGYEDICGNLRKLGADIRYID